LLQRLARLAEAALLRWHSEWARLQVATPVPVLVVRVAPAAQVAAALVVRVAVAVQVAFALREPETAKRRARQTLARTESTP